MRNFLKTHNRLLLILIPALIGVIYIILCATNLTRSIWFDESYSAYLTRYSFPDIWSLTSVDVHPPLFYFLLKIWGTLFGNADFALRFMSAFFGAVALIFAYQLIKRPFGVKTAAAATLAMALSPVFIRYGQEMRMYTIVIALVFAATYFLSLAVDTKKRKYWIIYGVLISLGMWTHYFAALAWLAHLIWLITVYKKHFWHKNLITSYALAAVLYIPWLIPFVIQSIGIQGGFWIGPNTANTITDFLGTTFLFSSGSDIRDLLVPLFLALMAVLLLFLPRLYRKLDSANKPAFRLLLSLAFLPPLILLILSTPPLKPLFVDRYVIYSSTAISLLVGFIVIKISSEKLVKSHFRLSAGAITILYIIASVVGLVNVNNYKNSNAKGLYYDVAAMSTDGEPIISNSEMLYYDLAFYGTPEHPTYFIEEITKYQWGSHEPLRRLDLGKITDLDAFLATHDTFWYVGSKPKSGLLAFPRDGYEIISDYEVEIKPGEGLYQALEFKKLLKTY
jgi:uncharacterized membrane protein